MRISLRKKITLWYIFILAISLILFSIFIYFVLNYSLNLRTVGIIDSGSNVFTILEPPPFPIPRIPFPQDIENKIEIVKSSKEGNIYTFSPETNIEKIEDISKNESILEKYTFNMRTLSGEEGFRIITATISGYLTRDTLYRLFYIILLGIISVIVIATLTGNFVTKKVLQPIDKITETVRDIEIKNLSKRLNFKGPEDEIVKLANTFDVLLDKVQSSFKKQRQFTSDASHELKTPLTVIKTNIDVALQNENITKEDYKNLLNIINNEVNRMSKITSDLLLLSDLDENNQEKEYNLVNINDLIKRVYKLSKRSADIKELNFDLIESKKDLIIPGSRFKLEQLFLNLVDNAIKFTDEGGSVKIILEKENDKAVISIKDTGIGIDKEDLPHIFDRFYRVDKAHTRKKEGFGLGLAICKRIVDLHKGNILVESEKNKGSTFKVKLTQFL